MIRVLHMVGTMRRGGEQAFVMNIYRKMNRKRIVFDFLVTFQGKNDYEEEILSYGGKLFLRTSKRENILKNFLELLLLIKKEQYKIVHIHAASTLTCFDIIASKLGGANKIIVHSHNTKTWNKVSTLLCRPLLKILPGYFKFACSREAGEFTFGKKLMDKNKVTVIPNAIDVQAFKYNPLLRAQMKQKYALDGKFVIGHTGRFVKEKNHSFILDIFLKLEREEPDGRLVLVGGGKLEKK